MVPQHLLHPLVAKPFGHLGGAFDVAEQDGDGAVWSGVRAKVGLFRLDCGRYMVNRSPDIHGGDALEFQLACQHPLHQGPHTQLAGDGQGLVE